MGTAGGIMEHMASDETMTHLSFSIPSRGTMGLKTRILNATHGEAMLFHHFKEYGPYTGEMAGRKNGGMIAMSTARPSPTRWTRCRSAGVCSWRRATIATRA